MCSCHHHHRVWRGPDTVVKYVVIRGIGCSAVVTAYDVIAIVTMCGALAVVISYRLVAVYCDTLTVTLVSFLNSAYCSEKTVL